MSEATMLLQHGTKLMQLKAVNVIQAAAADIRLRDRKRSGEAELDRQYSFHRRHVQKAHSIGHLIAIALFEPTPTTDKFSTMVVYGDDALLRAALLETLHTPFSVIPGEPT
jgi:hypothetical protein